MEKGYVQIYTGDGKGKTTAALGLGLRATGRGFKVLMVQFLKGSYSGEHESVKRLEGFTILPVGGVDKFTWQLNEQETNELKNDIQDQWKKIFKELDWESLDILILDEIMATISCGFITVEQVCEVIDNKPVGMEIILTGRNTPKELVDRADLITEMNPIKHYMNQGVMARNGIER